MDTYLPPIEKPRGIFLKMVFYFTKRQFGKVMTPMKVFVARMPAAFAMRQYQVEHPSGIAHPCQIGASSTVIDAICW